VGGLDVRDREGIVNVRSLAKDPPHARRTGRP
jgi:hypothetical protein